MGLGLSLLAKHDNRAGGCDKSSSALELEWRHGVQDVGARLVQDTSRLAENIPPVNRSLDYNIL